MFFYCNLLHMFNMTFIEIREPQARRLGGAELAPAFQRRGAAARLGWRNLGDSLVLHLTGAQVHDQTAGQRQQENDQRERAHRVPTPRLKIELLEAWRSAR